MRNFRFSFINDGTWGAKSVGAEIGVNGETVGAVERVTTDTVFCRIWPGHTLISKEKFTACCETDETVYDGLMFVGDSYITEHGYRHGS